MNREVELGSHIISWTIFCFSRSQQLVLWTLVFVTLFPTSVERASCKVHGLLFTGWLPTTVTYLLFWSHNNINLKECRSCVKVEVAVLGFPS